MAFAFVFPGQGSQSVGMMAAYGDSSVVRSTFDEASAVLAQDLWQLLAEGPAEVLAQTINTQPVMLTAGVAVYRLWLDKGGKLPAVVAGHSLGEYSALVAAGVIAFQDAVPLVRLRAAAMQEAVPAGAGAMAAILGLDDDGIAPVSYTHLDVYKRQVLICSLSSVRSVATQIRVLGAQVLNSDSSIWRLR